MFGKGEHLHTHNLVDQNNIQRRLFSVALERKRGEKNEQINSYEAEAAVLQKADVLKVVTGPCREPWKTLKESGLIIKCSVKSTQQPAKAVSRPLEEQQLLRSPKPLTALPVRCLSLAPLQMGTVVSLQVVKIHQLPGYSKQTLSDSGLTGRQMFRSPYNSQFCLQ